MTASFCYPSRSSFLATWAERYIPLGIEKRSLGLLRGQEKEDASYCNSTSVKLVLLQHTIISSQHPNTLALPVPASGDDKVFGDNLDLVAEQNPDPPHRHYSRW